MCQPSYWMDRVSGPPIPVHHAETPPLDRDTIKNTLSLYLDPSPNCAADDTTLRLLRGHVAILITELESALHTPAPTAASSDIAGSHVILQEARRKLREAHTTGLATSTHGPRLARAARALLTHLDKLSEPQAPQPAP
ncbi:DUF6415 family natural product biosynthesis protein [Streptomyces sp. NPDC056480]|uniref:DUF6415 family natural product biosynthesis protein n=1 Tax=Streptomyces sp. NPDC056480 TaxID=3345833 RepID=UPI0036815539